MGNTINEVNLLMKNIFFTNIYINLGINPNSLDQSTVESIKIIKYDGRNWEKSFEKEKDKPDGIQTKSK